MTITITDPATLATLAALTKGVEVRGPGGQFLGRFVPPVEIEFPELGISREELDRRSNAPASEWVTGDEVVAHLRSLRRDG